MIFTNGDNYNLSLGAMTLTPTSNSGQTFTNNMVNGTTTIASYQSLQTSGSAGTLTFNGNSPTGTTAIGSITAATPADMKLAQSGSGILQLNGAANYTGTTTISGGTLSIGSSGSLANTGVAVSGGATFQAYAGAILGTSGSGAATLIASSTSTLTFTDSGTPGAFNLYGAGTGHALTLNGATMNFDVGGASTAADELVVNGGSSASMTGTDTIDIYASPGTTSLTPGDYTLIADTGLTKADFALGTSTLTVGSTTYNLSLADSTSSDEVLSISFVPEPTSVGFVAIGAVGLLMRRRRRQTA
jgi:autotransporter-associated beta strand protein